MNLIGIIALTIYSFVGTAQNDVAEVAIAWDNPGVVVDSYEVIDNGRRLGLTNGTTFTVKIDSTGQHIIEVKAIKNGNYSPAAMLILLVQ